MRMIAAIVLATVVATPALAIDIVSGSGMVIKNGAGLNVVNGAQCVDAMLAVCLDREGDRRRDVVDSPAAPVEEVRELETEDTSYPEQGCKGQECD